MKKYILIFSILALLILPSLACTLSYAEGSGHVITEERSVSGFTQVNLAGSGDLILTQGDQESVKVEAEDNLMQYIRTEVKGDTLYAYIHSDGIILHQNRPIKYYVTVKDIKSLEVYGSGNITSDEIQSDNLDLTVHGSGDISLDKLAATSVTIDISGSGNCDIAGKVTSQSLDLKGSGDYDVEKLESQSATVEITGSGNATIWAKDEITGRISGSGNLDYYGQPKLSVSTYGSGSVKGHGNP